MSNENLLILIIVLLLFGLAFFIAMYRRERSERSDVAKSLVRQMGDNMKMANALNDEKRRNANLLEVNKDLSGRVFTAQSDAVKFRKLYEDALKEKRNVAEALGETNRVVFGPGNPEVLRGPAENKGADS